MFYLVAVDQLKAHTVSRKSERLVNLTIALLATKRFLTKAEIFATVAGYSGDSEAKDRMFERDKEDLRSLGIEIELGTFDPLFEDEAGYRIKPDNYALQLKDLDPTSIALLSRAAQMWRSAVLSESAATGLRKLKSLGIESDVDVVADLTASVAATPEQLPDLIEAITQRRRISFEYRSESLASEVRLVEPYRLSNSRGYWYLIAFDTHRSALRTFRLDRFNSTISFQSSPGSYEIDLAALDSEEVGGEAKTGIAEVAVRKGKGASLRSNAQVSEIDSEWDCLTITYEDADSLIREILWVGENGYLIAPADLKSEIVERLKKAVALHG